MSELIESMETSENTGVIILQVLIILLAIGIIVMLYMEKNDFTSLNNKMDAFKCPDPPPCPKCPDVNCDNKECPDLVCPKIKKCPKCPKCPDVKTSCPKTKTITIKDIQDAIFPGRNKGITSHGEYFALDGLGKGNVERAWSQTNNLAPTMVGGDMPAAISFSDQKLLSDKSSLGLATKKQPALPKTQGVFSKKSDDSSKEEIKPKEGTKPKEQTKPKEGTKPKTDTKPKQSEPKPKEQGFFADIKSGFSKLI